ncbi:hypothetical protein BC834DRAFT_888996 [Gloeopeniophorella convolvens]|nr:hypothetical protein BC834DRAFT_888996 [Gloeopeniophorella convolvens]
MVGTRSLLSLSASMATSSGLELRTTRDHLAAHGSGSLCMRTTATSAPVLPLPLKGCDYMLLKLRLAEDPCSQEIKVELRHCSPSRRFKFIIDF